MSAISERAVLVRFSAGVPGEEREDHRVSAEVKQDKGLSDDSGKWEKRLWPKNALATVKSKIGEARRYFMEMTIPFDTGTGILPSVKVMEFKAKLNEYAEKISVLAETEFLADPTKWIEWAKQAHNGTFEPDNYPGCSPDGSFDPDVFRTAMRRKFYVRANVMPVPNSAHYTETVALVLGQDAASVDQLVAEAALDARKELVRRLMTPVKHMAKKLLEDKPRIYATMIENIREIAQAAKDLNVTGDAEIDGLVSEVTALTRYSTDVLRESSVTRAEAQKLAQATLDRLAGYKL